MRVLPENSFRNFLISVNLVFGCILFFGMYTDYQFEDRNLNFIFPSFVFMLASALLSKIYTSSREGRQKGLMFSAVPLVIVLPYLITLIICLIPFFTCGCIYGFGLFGQSRYPPVLLESQLSPDRLKKAEVYYSYSKGDGATGGYIDIYVRYHFLPFVTRNIYESYTPKSYEAYDYSIEWVGDNIEFINSGTHVLDIGIVQFQWPQILAWYDYLFQ